MKKKKKNFGHKKQIKERKKTQTNWCLATALYEWNMEQASSYNSIANHRLIVKLYKR